MIVIDVEIENAIPVRGEPAIEGIKYCDGWRDFAGMGISVVCTYDTDTHLSRAFLKEDFEELNAYLAGNITAGFNTEGFDIPLLADHGVEVPREGHFDVLAQVWTSLGRRQAGWTLDNIMQGTFGIGKSGSGAMAPIWWQQGKRGRVIDYCLRDVWLEAKLVVHCLAGKEITSQGNTILVLPP